MFKGYEQEYRKDYTSTTSPTVQMESWRILLHIAVALGWDAQQIDVKTAFLYGLLPDDEVQYMEPEGIWRGREGNMGVEVAERNIQDEASREDLEQDDEWCDALLGIYMVSLWVMHLLSQECLRYHYFCCSCWQFSISHWPTEWECCFQGSDEADLEYLWLRTSGKGHLALAVFRCFSCSRASWDILRHPRMLQDALGQLKHLKTVRARWPFPDEEAHFCVGIAISHDKEARTVSLSQTALIHRVVTQFGQQDAYPMKTPMDPGLKLRHPSDVALSDQAELSKYPYWSLVSCLLYLSVASQPDITYTIQQLSQFLDLYFYAHW